MKEWEKGMSLGVTEVLNKSKSLSSSKTLDELESADLKLETPLGKIRDIARRYSKRHKVPIRISEEAFKDYPGADAIYLWDGRKSTVYLHPLLKYYTESYIKSVIEHEIDHMKVEKKWDKIL